MSEIVLKQDLKAFCLLTDYVLSEIWKRGDAEAKKALEMIFKRNLPKLAGQTSLSKDEKKNMDALDKVKSDLIEDLQIKEEDVVILTVKMDYGKTSDNPKDHEKTDDEKKSDNPKDHEKMDDGKKSDNPMDYVHFYKKGKPDEAFTINKQWASRLLPNEFCEYKLRIYCRRPEACELLSGRFAEWCKEKGYPLPPSPSSGSSQN